MLHHLDSVGRRTAIAIVIGYEPVTSIQQQAYAGGLGDFERFRLQRQLALAQNARAGQQQMFDQQSRLAAMAMQANQANMDRAARVGLANRAMAFDAARMGANRQWQVEDRNFAADERFDLAKMGEDEAMKRMIEGTRRAEEMADAAALRASEDDRRAFIMDRYDKGEWTMDDGTRLMLQNIRSKMMATRRSREFTPADKQRKLQEYDREYWEILGTPPPPIPGEKKKTFQEEFMSEAFALPGPDGSVAWISRDRSGAPREVARFDSPRTKPDPAFEARKEMAKVFASQTYDTEGVSEPVYTPEELDAYIATGKIAKKMTPQQRAEAQAMQERNASIIAAGIDPATVDNILAGRMAQQQPQGPPPLQSGMGPIGQGSLGRGIMPQQAPPPQQAPQAPAAQEVAKLPFISNPAVLQNMIQRGMLKKGMRIRTPDGIFEVE